MKVLMYHEDEDGFLLVWNPRTVYDDDPELETYIQQAHKWERKNGGSRFMDPRTTIGLSIRTTRVVYAGGIYV